MKRKTMSHFVMTGALSLTILSGTSASSGSTAFPQLTKEQTAPFTTRTGPRNFADVITQQADELGIDIKDDDLQTAARKVRVAKLQQQAAALGIDSAGKSERELQLAVKQAQKQAVYSAAKQANVETAGRLLKEIVADIAVSHPESAAQLNQLI